MTKRKLTLKELMGAFETAWKKHDENPKKEDGINKMLKKYVDICDGK